MKQSAVKERQQKRLKSKNKEEQREGEQFL